MSHRQVNISSHPNYSSSLEVLVFSITSSLPEIKSWWSLFQNQKPTKINGLSSLTKLLIERDLIFNMQYLSSTINCQETILGRIGPFRSTLLIPLVCASSRTFNFALFGQRELLRFSDFFCASFLRRLVCLVFVLLLA